LRDTDLDSSCDSAVGLLLFPAVAANPIRFRRQWDDCSLTCVTRNGTFWPDFVKSPTCSVKRSLTAVGRDWLKPNSITLSCQRTSSRAGLLTRASRSATC